MGTIVITLGENGSIALRGEECFHVPAHKTVAVDTTAAGDSFTGALALWLTQGKNLRESVQFATRVASITVTRSGAQTSLPYLAEIESIFTL